MSEQRQTEPAGQPGSVIGVLSVTAEAEVIPGPETLAAQAEAGEEK